MVAQWRLREDAPAHFSAFDPRKIYCSRHKAYVHIIDSIHLQAVAVARTYLLEDNALDLTCQPAFRDECATLCLTLSSNKS